MDRGSVDFDLFREIVEAGSSFVIRMASNTVVEICVFHKPRISSVLWKRLKTGHPIERFIREPDRKFERIGIFPSLKGWERTTCLGYMQLLEGGYRPTQS